MSRYYNKRKKSSNSLSIIRVVLFCLFIVAFSGAVFTQTQAMRIKSQNKKFENKMTQISQDNEKTKQDISKLKKDVNTLNIELKTKTQSSKIAYLTFDDGPSSNTRTILNTLKKYNVKATFFVNGKPELADLYKAIAADGHALANHTYSHDYRSVYSSPKAFRADIEKLDKFLQDTTGQAPTHLIRYPGGSNNTISHNYGGRGIMKEVLKEMSKDYEFFDWNVDSTDASTFRQNKDKIVSSVLRESKYTKKAIILMHDLNPKTTTPEALPEIIEGLKAQGFTFDVLSKDSATYHFTEVPKV